MKGASRFASKKVDTKLAVKKGATAVKEKKAKGAKDPNMPKRPVGAFFVFMEDFRKSYKEKNPDNKSVAAVSKAGGIEWKSMSDADKAPYQAQAEERKKEYEKQMQLYNTNLADGGDDKDDECDKSKSQVEADDENDEDGNDDE